MNKKIWLAALRSRHPEGKLRQLEAICYTSILLNIVSIGSLIAVLVWGR